MLNGSLDPQYQAFGLCLLLGWGSLRTIQDLEASITPLIEPLNDSQLMAIQRVVQVISRARGQEGVHLHLSNRVNPNLVMLLISRLSKESARKAYETYVSKAAMNNICLLDLRDKMELPEKIRNQSEAVRALAVVRRSHDRGHLIPGSEFRRRVSTQVLASVSRRILSAPESYPLLLVDAAESAGRALLSGRITPVVDIARREGWFE